MGDPNGFLKYPRSKLQERPVGERVKDYDEIIVKPSRGALTQMAARCMDCGIPFCHSGCPLGNPIPEFNDHVYDGRFDEAAAALLETNNFPEITGRVCPAPCEASCVLNIDKVPVNIKAVEYAIGEHVLAQGLTPRLPAVSSGQRVAVVGSGPAGLAAAQQLARSGHDVTVYERHDRVGGLLRYGIPDFKLDKSIIDARVEQMRAEGVHFHIGVDVGEEVSGTQLLRDFDAIVLCVGARQARDLPIAGRDLAGIEFAMRYLTQQNRRVAQDTIPPDDAIVATGKHVVVIGGGDTGSDCVGTANRQGAASVTQIELMPRPPDERDFVKNPWPQWPLVMRTSSSQEEGCERDFAVMTRSFVGEAGRVVGLDAVRVEFVDGRFVEIPGTQFTIAADLVLLAMGFTGPKSGALFDELGLVRTPRSTLATDVYGATNVPGVFAAGDASRGQSLVVWAIADGRRVAAGVDRYLRSLKRDAA